MTTTNKFILNLASTITLSILALLIVALIGMVGFLISLWIVDLAQWRPSKEEKYALAGALLWIIITSPIIYKHREMIEGWLGGINEGN